MVCWLLWEIWSSIGLFRFGVFLLNCQVSVIFVDWKLNILNTWLYVLKGSDPISYCLIPYVASPQSRLAVNSVTAGDYTRPLRISNFINELDSGFRLLNLKNDPLRKRYDGLKYDVKKIEEVVYDLSIRGLAKEPESSGADK